MRQSHLAQEVERSPRRHNTPYRWVIVGFKDELWKCRTERRSLSRLLPSS